MASLLGMTIAGLWANHLGLARVAMLAVFFLGLGSILAGAAPNLTVLVIGRAVQGLGIGIDLVTMYVIIGRMYPEGIRSKALGMLAGAWVVPGLIGPGLAGLLVEYASWRMAFLIVPVLLLGPVLLLVPILKKLPDSESTLRTDGRIQITAVLVAIVALSIFQGAASQAGNWKWLQIFALVAMSLAALGWAIKHLMPPGYLRMAPGIPAVIGMRGALAGSYFAAEVFVPLALQEMRGVPVALSGGILTAATIFWFAGSWLQGSHKLKISREAVLVIGSLFGAIGIALIPVAVFVPNSKFVAAAISSFVWGLCAFGLGLCFPTLGALMLEMSPEAEHPRLSASLQMSDSFGVILMTAVAGGVLTAASFDGELTAGTFTKMWLFCAVLGLFSVSFVRQIHRNSPIAR
jgi:MFS family permease